MTSTTASDTRHIRDVLPFGLIRDLRDVRPTQPPPPAEPPSASIKDAIVRWLNAEL